MIDHRALRGHVSAELGRKIQPQARRRGNQALGVDGKKVEMKKKKRALAFWQPEEELCAELLNVKGQIRVLF